MKIQWQIYRTLELIPEATPCPKATLWRWLVAPVRRSLAAAFVRDLSHKHQVLLLKRCLDLRPSSTAQSCRSQVRAKQEPVLFESVMPTQDRLDRKLAAQQWINRGGLPWWTWYDT